MKASQAAKFTFAAIFSLMLAYMVGFVGLTRVEISAAPIPNGFWEGTGDPGAHGKRRVQRSVLVSQEANGGSPVGRIATLEGEPR